MKTSNAIALLLLLLGACGGETVTPPPTPTTIELRLATINYVYEPGQRVGLVAVVRDEKGAVMPDVEVLITTDSPDRAEVVEADIQEAAFRLQGSGQIGFNACLFDLPELCDGMTLVVDDGQPTLAIEQPAPGDEISDPAGIVVRGMAADGSGSLTVFVNGTLVPVGEGGVFETTLEPGFGVRHIEVVASDGLTAVSRAEMDVLWASGFDAAVDEAGKPRFGVGEGLGIWLGQDFFDNDVPLDVEAVPVVARDVADLVELVILEASLTGILPPSVPLPGGSLVISGVTLADPSVSLSVQDDGVDLYVRVGNLHLVTDGSLTLDGDVFQLDGTLDASAIAYVRLKVTKASAEADVDIELDTLQVGIESVDANFVDDEVDALFTLAQGALRTTLENQVRDALGGVLAESVPQLLEGLLASLDHALESYSVTIDQAPLPALTITLNGRIGRIDSTYRHSLLAPFQLAISTGADNKHPDSLGVARMSEAPIGPGFFNNGVVQVGLHFALLNGALHVLWSSGLLDLDVTSFLPAVAQALISEARVASRMAPVARPPRPDEDHDVILSIGQLELELVTSAGETIRFGVNAEVGVDLTVAANKITLTVAETPKLRIWQIGQKEKSGLITADLIEQLFLVLWPDLRGSIGSLLAIDLPIPPLDVLGEIAPDLAGLTLRLDETGSRLYPRGEMLLLDGAFTGSVPAP